VLLQVIQANGQPQASAAPQAGTCR